MSEKVFLKTYGCQMNVADSERVKSLLLNDRTPSLSLVSLAVFLPFMEKNFLENFLIWTFSVDQTASER